MLIRPDKSIWRPSGGHSLPCWPQLNHYSFLPFTWPHWSLKTAEPVPCAWWLLSWMTLLSEHFGLSLFCKAGDPTVQCLFVISMGESFDHLKSNISNVALILFPSNLLLLCIPHPGEPIHQIIDFLRIDLMDFSLCLSLNTGTSPGVSILASKFLYSAPSFLSLLPLLQSMLKGIWHLLSMDNMPDTVLNTCVWMISVTPPTIIPRYMFTLFSFLEAENNAKGSQLPFPRPDSI